VPKRYGGANDLALSEELCVRLLVKILDRLMPEIIVREELETQGIRVQYGR
jgi:hypothetical protein